MESEHPFIELARRAIRTYLATGEVLDPAAEPGDPPPSGVFVSLHHPARPGEVEGPLRGCIGTIGPRQPSVRSEIARSAVSAAVADPRFPPLEPGEVDDLSITVYLLGDARPVAGLDDLDPQRYGVIVEGSSGRRGLLLPALPGITDAAEQVAIARRKAGIPSDAPIRLSRFEAVILH